MELVVKKKKAEGGLMAAIKKVDREQSMKAKEGKVVRMTKRKSKQQKHSQRLWSYNV